MKKLLLVSLIIISSVTTLAAAGDVDFYHELNTKQRNGGGGDGDRAEWTLFKGTVGLTENIDFWADVDRDLYQNQKRGSNGSKKDAGWDTQFEFRFNTSGFTFGEQYFNFTPVVGLEWDYIEYDGGTAEDQTTKENYYISPRFYTTVFNEKIFLGFDPRINKNNQEGDTYLDLRNQVAFEFSVGRFDFSNWLEFYHYIGADESQIGENNSDDKEGDNYVLDIENYFMVSTPLSGNFVFQMEQGIEAYDTMSDANNSDVSAYLEPRITYVYEVSENSNISPYVGYRYTQGDLSNDDDDNWSEVVLGFFANAKF